MPCKKYLINLNDEERQVLAELARKGEIKARKFKRAMILLKADEGLSDPKIMSALNVSRPCVERLRKRFVEGGLEQALNEDPRPCAASNTPSHPGRSANLLSAKLRSYDFAGDFVRFAIHKD